MYSLIECADVADMHDFADSIVAFKSFDSLLTKKISNIRKSTVG